MGQITGTNGDDILVGTENDDAIYGLDGNDQIDGGEGNDLIDAGTGQNVVLGGGGDDHFVMSVVSSGNPKSTYDGGVGTDTFDFRIAASPLFFSTASANPGVVTVADNVVSNVEIFYGGAGNDIFAFTYGADGITAFGEGGDDRFSGGDGRENFHGGDGDDYFTSVGAGDSAFGDSGNDRFFVSGSFGGPDVTGVIDGGSGTDLVDLNISFDVDLAYGIARAGSAIFTITNVEQIRASAQYGYKSVVRGSDGDEVFSVNPLFDDGSTGVELYGRGGNDLLTGSRGADLLDGGAGDDVLDGGLGNDTVSYASAVSAVTVNLASGTASGGAGNDVLSGLENITGSAFDDVLTGSDSDNTIDGGAGADVMAGGLGNDQYFVDNVGDKVLEANGAGVDTVNSSRGYSLAGQFIENLNLLGSANIDAVGNSLDNVIRGNLGNNVLEGGLGNDTLDGGAGSDTASYASASAGVAVNLIDGTVWGGAGSDTLISIENLIGSAFADTLVGNDGDNVIDGGAGADVMAGRLGNDTYSVDNAGDRIVEADGGGIDTVRTSVNFSLAGQFLENIVLTGSANINGTGNSLDNTLTGNAGNNVLDGGGGADLMAGGQGDDTYVVDNALDMVIESNGAGNDTVNASVSYSLAGQFIENLTLTGASHINATGNSLDNRIVGNSGDNVINGGIGADTMIGGAGNDTYFVDNAADIVIEASGGGIDTVSASVSFNLAGQFVENLILTGTANINATGNSLDNVLRGNSGANTLSGGAGADSLHGGLGSDVLIGGSGADRFYFDTALGQSNVDTIADFTVGEDKIFLDHTVFAGVSTGALQASNFENGSQATGPDTMFVYNSATGALFYDPDGSGSADAVQIATLSGGKPLSHSDFIVF